MNKFKALVLFTLVLTGCATSNIRDTGNLITRSTTITLGFTDKAGMLILTGDPLVRATSKPTPTSCLVVLLYEDYPGCLLHEILHCFEGSWHQQTNSNYCEP